MKSSRSKALVKVAGVEFVGKAVLLDGREFVNCRFVQCLLKYRGGNTVLGPGCVAVDCMPEFYGSSARTVDVLSILGLLKFEPRVEK